VVLNTGPYTVLPDNSIIITANMQSETGFLSSHQLKSYVASKSRLKLAARAVLSADAGLLVVARTPSEEARSPGRRSNVENAPRRRPITGERATPTSHIRRAILRTPPVTRQSVASSARKPRPAGRSHYVVILRYGRKLVTRVRVMLP